MGSRVVAGGALLVLLTAGTACTTGAGGSRGRAAGPPATTSTAVPTPPAPASTTSTSTSIATSNGPAVADPPGAVTLHVTGVTLPETAAGGGGLRVLVRPATPGLTVRRRGAGGPVTACPVTSVAGPVAAGGCVDLAGGGAVQVSAWGVELRATGADAGLDEATVTYVPADESMTLVTPARPAGACAVRACTAVFSLTPPRAGSFSLDGRGGGGRPSLTLSSNTGPGGSIRTLRDRRGWGQPFHQRRPRRRLRDDAGLPRRKFRTRPGTDRGNSLALILWETPVRREPQA